MSRHRRLVAALAVTQTVGYGVLYYAFSVFLTPMTADLHASVTAVTGALTLSVVVVGVAGIPVGRWVDRHGGHALMTVGSVIGGLAVLAWSQVHTLTALYAVFILIGIAGGMVLYEPAFAVIIASVATARRGGAMLVVTVVAGFASSVFLPTAGLLTAHLGWRPAVAILAVVLLAVTVPLHALAVPRGHAPPSPATDRPADATARAALADRGFWLLAVAFTAQAAAVAVLGVLLVAYLIHLGHPPTLAAAIAGLLGILSVTGRLVTAALHRRHPITTTTAAVFAAQAAGIAALPLVGARPVGAIGCVIVAGLGFGVATIARPAILADRYGTTAYATISGAMTTPIHLAQAAAPLAGAALAVTAAGYTALMYTAAGACLIAAASLALMRTTAAVTSPALGTP